MVLKRIAALTFAVVSGLAAVMAPGPACAQTIAQAAAADDGTALAQAQPGSRPLRPRIRVTPRYPYRTRALPYPPPYDIEYPGPGFVRQCRSWLAQEYRPSGTVIVPRMHCWWERG